MGKIKFAYCDYCKKEISEPAKKPLNGMDKTVWTVIIIATLGIGLIGYLIHNKFARKKVFCPTCETKLKFSDEAFEKPKELEDKTAKEKIVEKLEKKKAKKKPVKEKIVSEEGEEEEKEEEPFYCPFCGEKLEEDIVTCPYCGAAVKKKKK